MSKYHVTWNDWDHVEVWSDSDEAVIEVYRHYPRVIITCMGRTVFFASP